MVFIRRVRGLLGSPVRFVCLPFPLFRLFGEFRANDAVGDEITIVGSFSEMNKFPAAIEYLDSGKVKVKGIVNKVFKIEEWEDCLEAMKNKSAIKAAIVFD